MPATEENLLRELQDISLLRLDNQSRERVQSARRLNRCCAGVFDLPAKSVDTKWKNLAESMELRMGRN